MINERINKLRKVMKREGVDAYIISGSDPHMSEYTAERWTTRRWITGFTGSAGLVVITADKAGLWTDSRYFLQAGFELEKTEVILFKVGLPNVPGYLEWLEEELHSGATVGSNVWTSSLANKKDIELELSTSGLIYKGTEDLLDEVWEDRPDFPCRPVVQLDIRYAGRSRLEKLSDIRTWMEKENLSWYLISSLPDIAWSLNLRGSDIEFNPLFLSYLLISKKKVFLYINEGQIPPELGKLLNADGIEVKSYKEIATHVKTLEPGRINLAPENTSMGAANMFKKDWELVGKKDVTVGMKAVKNEVEIASIKNAMKKDGAALVRFMIWLEENWPKGQVTELGLAEKLSGFRSLQDGFMGLSFSTIAGFNDHGAIIHYSADEKSVYTLSSPGALLLDSGGQYLDGTTDITRVLKSGYVGEDIIHDYTLVLKGHIDLALAVFPEGTKGVQLDILARKALWDEGRNYGHGTGHGVGFFLNVHEGPQVISTKAVDVEIKEGMITSNEPGIYIEGKYGIRIENLILTVTSSIGESENFMTFDTLTLCPLELDLIDTAILTELQIEWINNYHERVYSELSPLLEETEKVWLRAKTQRI